MLVVRPGLLRRSCFFALLAPLALALPVRLFAQTAHFSYAQVFLNNGFNTPGGVAVDKSGNIYIADTKNNAVEEIAPGCILNSCVVTLGSGFSGPGGVAVDANGNVFVADTNNHAVKEILAVNGSIPATPVINTLGSGFSLPAAIALDSHGNVFVADSGNATVKEIVAAGGYTTVNGLGSGYGTPSGVAVDAAGDVFITDSTNSVVEELVAVNGSVPASPTIKTLGSGFLHPAGVAVDALGDVFVADTGNAVLKELIAVSGSVPSSPVVTLYGISLGTPASVALGASGTIYTADSKNNAAVEIATQATNLGNVAVNSEGGIFTFLFTFDSGGQIGSPAIVSQGASSKDFLGEGGTCTHNATFATGGACTIKAVFNPRVAGPRTGAVLLYDDSSPGKILATANVYGTGLGPGSAFPPGIISSVAGNGTQGFSDNVAATSAQLNGPGGIAFDGSLNLYVSDTANQRVRVVNATTGVIATVAGGGTGCSGQTDALGDGCPATSASLATPGGIAIDGAGDLIIADTGDQRVRVVNAASGVIGTLAGGGTGCSGQTDSLGDGCPATSARLTNPAAVAIDGSGNVYIADTADNSVRVVNAVTGIISAVASVPSPSVLALDGSGNLFVANAASGLVVKVALSTGAVSSFAGGGTGCSGSTDSAGDGCPATNAVLSSPSGLAIDPAGDVYIADSGAKVVRVVNTATGIITVAAGGGTGCAGQSDTAGDNCAATSATATPTGVALDSLGHLYVSDTASQRVREIDLDDPAPLVFASTAVGSVSSTLYSTMESTGNTALALGGFTFYHDSNFHFDFNIDAANSTCAVATRSLAPGASCVTGILFQPTATGAVSSTVTVTNNSPNSGNIPVSGTATPAVPPPAPVIVSEPAAATTLTYATFTFTDTNPNVNFMCSIDQQPYSPCSSGITYNSLSVGYYHFFDVEAVDYLGNASTGTSFTWGVQAPLPFPVFTNGPPATTVSTSAVFTFTDSQFGVTFLCSLDNAAFTPCNSGISFTSLSVGAHSFAVEVQSSPAVFSGTSTLSWTILPTPPPTPIAAPASATAVDFGTVAIGQTSTKISIPFTFSLGGIMAAPQVLTQGAPNLDFALASTGTCQAGQSYAVGSTCTVDVTFMPKYAGIRYGAVQLQDPYGNSVGIAYLRGIGSGPQVAFPNYKPTALGGGFSTPYGVAVDGTGNVFVADDTNTIRKIPAGCTSAACTLSIGTNFSASADLALDGAGNLFVADVEGGAVREIPAGCALDSCIRTLSTAFTAPLGIALDANGNVFVTDGGAAATGNSEYYPNGSVSEILAAGGYTTVKTLHTGIADISGVAVDSNSNVFITSGNNTSNSAVAELPAAGGYSTLTSLYTNLYSPAYPAFDGVGNLYVSDQGNNALKMLPAASSYSTASTLLTYPASLGAVYGITLDPAGNIYATVPGGNTAGVYYLDNVDPPSLVFRTTSAGSIDTVDGTLSATIENIGNAPLTFSALTAPAANFNVVSSATTCSTSTALAVGASCNVGIQFAPTMAGTLTNSFVFVDNNKNASGSSQSISLSGPAEAALPPPAPTITSQPANPSGSFNASFSFTDTQAGVTYLCSLDAAAYTACTSPINYTLANGAHTFAVRASDLLNNLSPITSYNWTISALPVPAITAGPANPTIATTAGFSFTDTLSGGTFLCSLDGAAYSACTSGVSYSSLAAGSHTFGVEVTNSQSETSAPATFTWTVATSIAVQNGSVQDFGTVAIGQTSVTIPFTYTFTAAATLGSPLALTQGAPNLDFSIAGGSCISGASFATGATCTLNVTFTPAYAGVRPGALVLKDQSGNTLATIYLHGIGAGPQIRVVSALNLGPGSETSLGGGFSNPTSLAVDGAENVYVADSYNNAIKKIPAGCLAASCVVTLASGLYDPMGVAIDGAGNVYFSQFYGNLVMEIPFGCTASSCFINLGGGYNAPDGLAVDGSGNVFVADFANNAVKEIPRGCLNAGCVLTLGSGFIKPESVAVDPSGNLLVVEYGAGNSSNSGATGCNQNYCVGNSVTLLEIMAAGGYTNVKTIQNGFGSPINIVTDGVGNAYITQWASGYGEVQELSASQAYAQIAPLNQNCGATQASICNRGGAAVDGAGNVYSSDTDNGSILRMNFATTTAISFATPTTAGTLDLNDPLNGVGVMNFGNAPLTFSTIAGDANFTPYADTTPCATGTPLAVGSLCYTGVAFTPTSSGPITGTLTLTDNNLNAATATQTVALSGTGLPQAPVLTAYPPTSAATTATFSFTDAATNATFLCSLDGAAFTTCVSGVSYSSLTLGSHTFSVEAQDSLGDISSPNSYTWYIYATSLPTPTIIQEPSNPTTATTATFAFADSQPGVSYICILDGNYSALAACTNGITYNSLSVSTHTLSVIAVGQYGGSANLSYTWSIVTALPPPPAPTPVTPPAPPLPQVTSGNFGSLPIAQTSPSQAFTMTFSGAGTGTIGSIAYLTHGVANLDFQQASGGTCTVGATYTATTTCTVAATFTPTLAGYRKGAVVIQDTNGTLLSIAYIQGVGTGPQISFPAGISTTFTTFNGVTGNGGLTLANASADASGTVYTTEWYNPQVQVIPPGCTQASCTRTIPVFGWGSTVDGAGNLFVAGGGITMVPQGCYFTSCQIPVGGSLGLGSATGVAVSGAGDLYIADVYNYYGIDFSTAASGYSTLTDYGGGYDGGPRNVAVDVYGNMFSANYDGGGREIPAGCTALSCEKGLYTSSTSPISNFMTGVGLDGVGNAYFYSTALSVGTVSESYVSTNYATSSTLPGNNLAEGLGVDDLGNLLLPLDNFSGGSSAPAGTPVTRTLTRIDFNTPPTVTFPTSTAVGSGDTTDGTLTTTIRNNGNGAMTFSALTLSNPSFTFDSSATTCSVSAPLAAQATCTVGVKFAPLCPGSLTGTLTLADNNLNATNSTQLITLVGTGTGSSCALAATTTALQASSQSPVAGSSVTFTAQVSRSGGTPGGIVTFLNGASPIGTGTLNGSGIATFSTSALTAGAHTITASYGGDSADAASVSTAITVTVSPVVVSTRTTLQLSATSSAVGLPVGFYVTVVPLAGAGTPTGTLTLLDGATTIGSGSLDSNGTFTLNLSTLAVGKHTIQASYGGDAADAKSSSITITLTILPVVSTTTTLTATPASALQSYPVTFTATIVPASGTVVPTGTVTFYDGATAIGSATVGSAGTATFPDPNLALGAHSITAVYGGDTTNLTSTSSAVNVYIATSLAVTSTTLSSSSSSVPEGGSVTLTAAVAQVAGTGVPTGTVTFYDGATSLGAGTLTAKGVASLSTTLSTLGAHSIKAAYAGDHSDLASTSAALSVTATIAPTTTTVRASASSVAFGQKIVFTATVTSSTNATVPTGTVTFKDGATILGTGTLNPRGEAEFSTTSLTIGTHTITATYAGDSNNAASASGGTFVSVTALATVTTVSASAASISTGKSITFTAVVAPTSGSTVPTGTVTFTDGVTPIGTGTLNSDGAATFSTTSLALGTHSITASYGGDINDAVSTSAIIAVVVTAPPTPTVALSPAQLTFTSLAGTPSAAQTVTVQNTGTVALTLTGITLGGVNPANFATSTTCGGTLAAGAGCSISVTFTSYAATASAATLIVADNATGSPQTISLSGTATTPPAATLSPTSLSFPSTTVNVASTPLPVTLTNSGNAALSISGVAITGAAATSFSQTNNCPASLASNATCTINVTFTPASVATGLTASLAVTDNAAGSPQSITLTGTGTAVPAPIASLSTSSIVFPNTLVSTTSAALPVTLTNTGNAALTLNGIAITGAAASSFSQTNNCPSSLAANAGCTVNVTFTPGAATTGLAASLTFTDNASGSPQLVSLTGTGIAPVAALSAVTLSFPSTTVNVASAPLPVTFSNVGTASLTLSNIAITGTAATSYSQTNNCPASLAAGANCTVNVTFKPASVATGLAASLTFTDNASGSPQSVALTGTGTAVPAPVASLTPATLAFPNTVFGTTATALPVTLANTGNAALTGIAATLTGTNPGSFTVTSASTCGTTLAAGATCTFLVSFSPAAQSSYAATLSVADNASGSPQTVALSGTGIPLVISDYALSIAQTAPAVDPGTIAQFVINVASINGAYNSPVTFSASGLPPGATATFAPVSVTPGSGSASSVLSIQTPLTAKSMRGPLSSPGDAILAALVFLPLLGLRRARRFASRLPRLTLLVALAALALPLIALTGCGGSGYFGPQPQSYTVTITGSSGATQHSTTVTLTIQ